MLARTHATPVYTNLLVNNDLVKTVKPLGITVLTFLAYRFQAVYLGK